jgi:predicted regulator of Ras-like GTPase activity (Roadblock/LC7/MglB family)
MPQEKLICEELLKIGVVDSAAVLAKNGWVLDIAGQLNRITVAPIAALAGISGRILEKITCGSLSEIVVKGTEGSFILFPFREQIIFVKFKPFTEPEGMIDKIKEKLLEVR